MASLLQTVLNPLMRGGRLEYNGKEGKSAKVEGSKSRRVKESKNDGAELIGRRPMTATYDEF